jgi:hypothetical protein
LPPIESDLQSMAETGGDQTAETTNKKKKTVLKKIKKKSDVNVEEQEDLGIFVQHVAFSFLQTLCLCRSLSLLFWSDQKSIFPLPRTNHDVQEIGEIKHFTEFTLQRRATAQSKGDKMIDLTSVRTKYMHHGVKLRGGAKKWRPWATFTRSHKQDYEVHAINVSRSKHTGGEHVAMGVVQARVCISVYVALCVHGDGLETCTKHRTSPHSGARIPWRSVLPEL